MRADERIWTREELRAWIASEHAKLDAEEEETRRMEVAFQARMDQAAAYLKEKRVGQALRAAADVRAGWTDVVVDWQAILDEYGLDEYGDPIS